MCMDSEDDAVKPWSLVQVTYENILFVHTNLESFLSKMAKRSNFSCSGAGVDRRVYF